MFIFKSLSLVLREEWEECLKRAWGFELGFCAAFGVVDCEFVGVEMESVFGFERLFVGIKVIAEDGVAEFCHMDAQLVGSSGYRR